MSPPSQHPSSAPLLGGSPKLRDDSPIPPLSSTTQAAIKVLTAIRLVGGGASLFAPRFTCGLFKYIVPADQALMVRLFGVRDAMLGELLITAEDKGRGDGGRRYATAS